MACHAPYGAWYNRSRKTTKFCGWFRFKGGVILFLRTLKKTILSIFIGLLLLAFSSSSAQIVEDLDVTASVVHYGNLYISGEAFPSGSVVIKVDYIVVDVVPCNNVSAFSTTINNIEAGNHLVELYGVDIEGRATPTISYIVTIVQGSTTNLTGVLLPPTIKLSDNYITNGETLTISGYARHQSTVTVVIFSPTTTRTVPSNSAGFWSYSLNFTLAKGSYQTYSYVTTPSSQTSQYSRSLSFTIAGKAAGDLTLTSPTHPDQTKWYSNNDPQYIWTRPTSITGFSFNLDQKEKTIPDSTSEGELTSKQYNDVADGTWYFHLRPLGSSEYKTSLHYKTHIDVTPPEFEYVRFREGSSTTSRRPTLEFSAFDATSGVSNYEYALDKEEFKKAKSPLKISHLKPGLHTVALTVYDKAGNKAESKIKIEIIALEAPKITLLIKKLVLLQDQRLEGTGPANTTLKLFISGPFGQKYVWRTTVDDKGKWVYDKDNGFLAPGEYQVYAKAFDSEGGESERSNVEKFGVLAGSIYIFGLKLPIWAAIAAIILLLAVIRYLSRFAPAIFSPRLKRRKIFVALVRENEVLLLEKRRELSTENRIFEMPSGEVRLGETRASATRKVVRELLPGVEIRLKKKIDFYLDKKTRRSPATISVVEWTGGDIVVDQKKGYIGHWWIDPYKKITSYFDHITSKAQQGALLLLAKSYFAKDKKKL